MMMMRETMKALSFPRKQPAQYLRDIAQEYEDGFMWRYSLERG